MKLTYESSNTLNYLKCILCIGVVFIHARYFPDLTVLGIQNIKEYKVYNAIDSYYNIEFLNCTCVPLFFLISGYLFFYNIPEQYDFGVFKRKWVSRVRSLLVPYLICNGLFLIYVIAIDLLHGEHVNISVLQAFWSYTGGYPLMAPTWYLRDLMVVCLFAPIIWLVIRYTNIILPLTLTICWLTNFWYEVPGLGIRAFLFFTIGAFIAYKKADIIEFVSPRKPWYIHSLTFFILYGIFIYNSSEIIHKMAILASFPVWICFARFITLGINKKCSSAFVTGTFFVFLYHFSIAHRVPVYLTRLFGVSEFSVVLCYFMGAIITTLSLLLVYYLGKKFMPHLFTLIVGGR